MDAKTKGVSVFYLLGGTTQSMEDLECLNENKTKQRNKVNCSERGRRKTPLIVVHRKQAK